MLDLTFSMFGRLTTRLLAAVMLLPLLALVSATGGFGLRCRITGEVLSACCCPDGADAAKGEPVATVSEADCCDRLVREVTSTTAEVSSTQRVLPDQPTQLPALALRALSVDVVRPERSSPVEDRASLGPPTGRLRLLAKSSFLI